MNSFKVLDGQDPPFIISHLRDNAVIEKVDQVFKQKFIEGSSQNEGTSK